MPLRLALHDRRRPLTEAELAGVPWLSHLKPDEYDRAAPELRVTRAEPGELIFRMGRPVTYWFGVVEGLLKMSAENADGSLMTFTGVPPGAAWCEILNTDSMYYGGSNLGNGKPLPAEARPWMGFCRQQIGRAHV